MVAVCNLCPSATKAIVWIKFSDRPWFSFIPKVFPFAYNTIPIGSNTYRLEFRFRKSNIITQYKVNIQYFSARFNRWENTEMFNRAYGIPNASIADLGLEFVYEDTGNAGFCDGGGIYSNPACPQINLKMRSRDLCGNFQIQSFVNSPGYNINTLFCIKNGTLPVITSIVAGATYNPITSQCSGCPIGWDFFLGVIEGQGEPIVEVTCGNLKCPPDTICECDCGTKTCCYDVTGTPTYSYLKF